MSVFKYLLLEPSEFTHAATGLMQGTIYSDAAQILPLGTCALYLLMVFCLPSLMQKISFCSNGFPKLVKYPMAVWNLFLSIFSVINFVSFGKSYLSIFAVKGVSSGLCDASYEVWDTQQHPMIMFWGCLFTFFKFAELLDTVFMILKNPKRNVPFLHWYHHFTVLLFCWYALKNRYGAGLTFMLINSGVHAIMYLYYFFSELDIPLKWAALPITIIQILQMVAGIALNVTWVRWVYSEGKQCSNDNPPLIISAACIIYGTYLYLFSEYFYKRYVAKVNKQK